MRSLGTFANSDQVQAPMAVVVVYDAASNEPQYALTQEGVTVDNVGVLFLNGAPIYVYPNLDNLKYQEQRAQGEGGIPRRTASMTLHPESGDGTPFALSPFDRKFYSGGQSARDFYFGIYAIDRNNILEDLTRGIFYGMFRLDADVRWTEEDPPGSYHLIDLIVSDDTIIGATSQDLPNILSLFNPWYSGVVVPKVFGQVPRVRLLSGTSPAYSSAILKSVNGLVRADFTDVSSYLVLEKNVPYGSALYALSVVAPDVRISLSNGEVISGTLVYDGGSEEMRLTAMTRNTHLTIGGLATQATGRPAQWGDGINAFGGDSILPAWWSYTETVLTSGYRRGFTGPLSGQYQGGGDKLGTLFDIVLNHRVSERQMLPQSIYFKYDAKFYDSGEPNNERTISKTIQVDEIGFGRTDAFSDGVVLTHERITDPTYGDTAVSFRYSSTSFGWPTGTIDHQEPNLDNLYFQSSFVEAHIYLIDPDGSATSGLATDRVTWSLLEMTATGDLDETAYYIQNGFSRFDIDNLYVDTGNGLMKLEASQVDSIEDDVTAFGLTGLTKITLTTRPSLLAGGSGEDALYADALYKDDDDTQSRPELLIAELLSESPILSNYVGNSLTADTVTPYNILPFVGCLCTGQTVTDVLDRLMAQLGSALTWVDGAVNISYKAIPGSLRTEIASFDEVDYVKPIAPVIDANDALMNSCELQIGKILAHTDADGYERITNLIGGTYGGWQDPHQPQGQVTIPFSNKISDRVISFNFDYINDRDSCLYAISLMLSAGHAAGFVQVERSMIFHGLMKETRWEAQDVVVLKNFPGVDATTDDNPFLYLDEQNYPHYAQHPDNAWFVMGALAVVEMVVTDFSIDGCSTTLTLKQCAPYTPSLNISAPSAPWPPSDPPTVSNSVPSSGLPMIGVPDSPGDTDGDDSDHPHPPGDPDGPFGPTGPGAPDGGGDDGAPWFWGTPMSVAWSSPEEMLVDSTDTFESDIEVRVARMFGTLGFTWTASIVAGDETGTGLSGTTGASVSDWENDAWVDPGPWTLTAEVDHTAFKSRGVQNFSYYIAITRACHHNRTSDIIDVEEVGRIEVACRLRELSGISYS